MQHKQKIIDLSQTEWFLQVRKTVDFLKNRSPVFLGGLQVALVLDEVQQLSIEVVMILSQPEPCFLDLQLTELENLYSKLIQIYVYCPDPNKAKGRFDYGKEYKTRLMTLQYMQQLLEFVQQILQRRYSG